GRTRSPRWSGHRTSTGSSWSGAGVLYKMYKLYSLRTPETLETPDRPVTPVRTSHAARDLEHPRRPGPRWPLRSGADRRAPRGDALRRRRPPGGRRPAPDRPRERGGRPGRLAGPEARLVCRLWAEPGPVGAAVRQRNPFPIPHRARAELRPLGPRARASRLPARRPRPARRAQPAPLRSPPRPLRRRAAQAGGDAALRRPAPRHGADGANGGVRRFQPLVASAGAHPAPSAIAPARRRRREARPAGDVSVPLAALAPRPRLRRRRCGDPRLWSGERSSHADGQRPLAALGGARAASFNAAASRAEGRCLACAEPRRTPQCQSSHRTPTARASQAES